MLANDNDKLQEVLNRLRQCDEYVYDAETSGLDWRVNHVVGHVLTFGPAPEDTYYVPIRHAGGGNAFDNKYAVQTEDGWSPTQVPRWEDQLILEMSRGDKVMIGHHLSFDLSMLYKLGFTARGAFRDTMVEAYLVNELRRSFSLDACCRDEQVEEKKGELLYEYLAEKFGGEAKRDQMANYWRTDASDFIVHDYATGDGTSTWQLHNVLMQRILEDVYLGTNKDGVKGYSNLEKVHEVESKLIPVLHNMRMRGIKIDENRLAEVYDKTNTDFEAAMEAIGNINVKAPTQVKKYFTDHGITDWPTTKLGNASFPEWWLEKTEPGQKIVAVRKNRTMLDSFLKPLMEKHLYNGRVHTEFHQTRDEHFGTVTGRLSNSGPNLTAVPGKRQGERGRFFRSIFIPDEGYEWDDGDFNTCEIRICAHYCRAKLWVEGYASGVDPHTAVSEALGIERRYAKAINLGLMTGMGQTKLAAELGIGKKEGEAVLNRYFGGLPELKKFQRTSKQRFIRRGFMSTLLGRRLRLEDNRRAYTSVNRLTQGGNADLTKSKLVEMSAVEEAQMLIPVHDSLGWQRPIGREDIRDEMVNIMERVDGVNSYVKMTVPMKVDIGSGLDWGTASFEEI